LDGASVHLQISRGQASILCAELQPATQLRGVREGQDTVCYLYATRTPASAVNTSCSFNTNINVSSFLPVLHSHISGRFYNSLQCLWYSSLPVSIYSFTSNLLSSWLIFCFLATLSPIVKFILNSLLSRSIKWYAST
jgi:hypothetical protein